MRENEERGRKGVRREGDGREKRGGERGVLLCITSHILALQRVNVVLLDKVIHEASMAILASKVEGSPATIKLYGKGPQRIKATENAHNMHQTVLSHIA